MAQLGVLLARGSEGALVARVQTLLNWAPHSHLRPLDVDGVFGSETDARVKEFQRNNSLFMDGVVGPSTYKALAYTPAEYQLAARRVRDVLVQARVSPDGLATFDVQVSRNLNAFMKEGGAQIIVPVAIGLFLLLCIAILALSPGGQQASRDLARWMEQKIDELRQALNLTPPSQVLAMIWRGIEELVNAFVERLQKERKKCGEINPVKQAECAAKSMAIAVQTQNVLRRLSVFLGPGPYKEEDLLKGLLTALGALVMAYSDYGKCIECNFIQFL